jgi:putative hemolysin
MTTGNWIELTIAIFALVIVTLSAWVETSLATVTRVNLRALLEGRFARSPERELEGPQYTRSSMLLIEMIGVGVSTALIAHIAWDVSPEYGLWIGIVIAVLLNVVFGRILPRIAVGDERSEQTATQGKVARALTLLFAPLIRPVDAIVGLFARRRPGRDEGVAGEDEDSDSSWLSTAGDRDADGEDEIEPVEQEMISGVLHLENATASQIMVPRIDIVGIHKGSSIEEATAVAIRAGHSRIPVYGQSIDEIQGIVYAKDLLKYVVEDPKDVSIEAILRPAYFVPESKRVDDLLRDLQHGRVHMAVVVDEYGGTAGVVTIEDIIEEIVGEIEDEYDVEEPYIEVLSDTEAMVAGKVSVDDLMHDLDLELPVAAQGTVGGLVQRELGHIPHQGETVDLGNVRITVMEVEHRRIRRVKVERLTAGAVEDSDVSVETES